MNKNDNNKGQTLNANKVGSNDQQRKAVALQYDGKSAPTVTATGFDEVADAIIALAKEHNIPLFENAELVKLLADIGLGEEIPETLYLCIAQILSFAYKLQGKIPAEMGQSAG
jgi:flagellar biosynthesis protein